jgi:hypothetical protein
MFYDLLLGAEVLDLNTPMIFLTPLPKCRYGFGEGNNVVEG